MSRNSLDSLGDLQRAVIEVVWKLGEGSVHDVRKQLGRENLAYTTVLTALQNLEKAGWLSHRTEGKSYIYVPMRTRTEASAGAVQRFLKRVFDGDAVAMLQHLIREGDLSEENLGEVRKMIEDRRREMRR